MCSSIDTRATTYALAFSKTSEINLSYGYSGWEQIRAVAQLALVEQKVIANDIAARQADAWDRIANVLTGEYPGITGESIVSAILHKSTGS